MVSICNKYTLAVLLTIISAFFMTMVTNGSADATQCFDTVAERESARQHQAYFPRGELSQINNGNGTCSASSSLGENWSLLASYYRVGSGGTALHTPRASFYMYTNDPDAAQISTQNTSIYYYGSRCFWDGRGVEVRYGSALVRTITDNPSAVTSIGAPPGPSLQINNVNWVRSERYGGSIWRTEYPITFQVPTSPGTTHNCKVKFATRDGHIVTFAENQSPTVGHTENNQRYNQSNWNGAGKRNLGPNNAGLSNIGSLYHSAGGNQEIEYSIPFAPDCNLNSQTFVRLRVYDTDYYRGQEGRFDATPASNGPFQSASYGVPSFRIYDETAGGNLVNIRDTNDNVLGTNVEVLLGSDEYIEYQVRVRPGRRYSWVWYNVQDNNGIQVWMPFSDILTIDGYDCTPLTADPPGVCTVTGLQPSYAPNQELTNLRFEVENTTMWDWDDDWALGAANSANTVTSNTESPFSGPMRIRIPNGTTVPINSSYTFNAVDSNSAEYRNAPSAPGIHYYRYRMHGGGSPNWLHGRDPPGNREGPVCTFAITVVSVPPPLVAPTCTIRFTQGLNRYEVDSDFTVTARVDNPNPATAVTVSNIRHTITRGPAQPGGANFPGGSFSVNGGGTVDRESGDIYSPSPGTSDIRVVISANVGGTNWTVTCTDAANAADDTITVEGSLRPYFLQFGGDVIAGGGIANPSNVCDSSNADVLGYLRGTDFNNYRGSSVELAIFAAGQVRAVRAVHLQNRTPSSLTFANQASPGIVVDEGDFNRAFGGGFGQQCVRDQFAAVNYNALTPINDGGGGGVGNYGIQGLTTGQYRLEGSPVQRISTSPGIQLGERVVIYRDGDVYLDRFGSSRTFGFASYEWQDVTEIPSLTLVVRGNIYIDSDITQLDGIYIAQPYTDNNGDVQGGEIFTCSVSNNSRRNLIDPLRSADLFGRCGSQLTVYGAFQADKIHLLRTVETANNAINKETISNSSGAGEVFIYPPELFLTQGGGLPSTSGVVPTESQIALPPVF